MTDAKQPAQFDWATELSDAEAHVSLSEQEAHEIGARLRSMGAKLKTYEDLGDAGSDVQLLRMGYAAARLEIESLKAQLHAAKQINTAQFGLLTSSIPGSALRASHWQAPAQTAPTTQPSPQQEAQEPCPTCAALARTVMLDQVSFDRKPDCYGIRQITDDEGVEEWEDIRTSPDVAREEATDMMATGRGELYEVVPLWTTPQPSPTAQEDALDTMRLDWLDADESRCVFHLGKSWYTRPSYGLPYRKRASLREAIEAARAAQEGK